MEGIESSESILQNEENGCSAAAAVNHSSDGENKHSNVNGLTNGFDKEKKEKEKHKDHHNEKVRDKEKHRDKDSEKHRSKERDGDKVKEKHKDHKDRDREKEKHRDKDKEHRDKSKHTSSSSSSKDKHNSSSSSKDKDKERKDKEKSKHHDDKERKDKEHKSSSSSKDKEHKSSSSSKHSSSSSSKPSSGSSSKDKEHKERDKERDREKDKHRDKEKDKDRSKDKHSSSSSRDKEKHSSERHKSDKDKHSSSKDKDKSSSSPEKKDKHRDKDREKEKSRDKDKEKSKEKLVENEIIKRHTEIKQEESVIKTEKEEDSSFFTSIKDESIDDDDEGKLMIKEEPMDDESKLDFTENSMDQSAVKKEPDDEDEDDIPMAQRVANFKRDQAMSESEDDVPLSARKVKKEPVKKRKKAVSDYEEDDEDDFKPAKKKKIKNEVKKARKSAPAKIETTSPRKKKKEEEEPEVWKWWEEEKKPDGVKWTFLEHKGAVFAPPYEPLPSKVKFYYDDEEMKLSEPAEEVATFYARMLDHDYTTKEAFNTNFMHDWRSVMTSEERKRITDLKKCNFKYIHAYFIKKTEERKAMSKEEKKAIKEKNDEVTKEYGFCTIDGHKEKIGNFRIEPPGLFRGRGEHPKMGKLKRRVEAEDIIINCSKDSDIPKAPSGHRWKEVRHDNSVTWLASWTENVQGQVKYIMLNPSSKLKGEKDWQKYEMARKLAKSIDKIRNDYVADWKSKEMRIRQRAVAMYFIDKLALRAGNEKDEDQADTVGCCSLRVEHIALHEELDGKEFVVVFDFLGKDSIRYYNEVPVEKRVFKNLTLFMENKKKEDDLFDRLNTSVLNKHLSDLMDGLTAKVFRTYNASWTLQNQLKELTDPDASPAEKLLAYNRANRAVAILCNHQRAVPKTHDKSMANLREKLLAKREAVAEAEKSYKHAKRDAKHSMKERVGADKAKKTLERLKDQLLKLEVQETDREENKTIALGTSKLNYLDPRISVAWCKKYDVPIEKIYNKTQRDKFRWAIDMATADYVF